ncbi:MAG: SurA N-terminal domain-containing protein [Gammaproteobacteria bacterium]|jgi:peptidyl-prolyl cis-trans isomerase D|nr:SurA N-terminal domain-containing protein [Gammaproteobacteria bacterium]
MLQTIRERLTGWFAWFILGAIALTLVVTFGNIDTGFSGVSAAATVNGEEIPLSEFRARYNSQRQQWEANFRAQIPDEVAESIADSVIQGLVRTRVISQHAVEQGYRVNDAELADAIQSNPVFYVGGKFSQPNYEQLLASQGLTPQRFEYEERQNMQVRQFAEGVAYSAFYTPSQFRRYIELDGERRAVEFVLLPPEAFLDQVTVAEAAIEERYEQSRQNFMTEESVALEYVEIDFAELLAEAEVSEEELRAYYADNKDEFRGPDQRRASHILIARGNDADAAAGLAARLAADLEGGADFAALAAEYSADTGSAAEGGSLGWLGAGDAPAQAFEDALFALEEGEISDPVETEFGFHLIRLDGLRPGARLAFDDARAELELRLREERAADRYTELVDELDERALESLDGLGPVAAAMGLPLRTVESFTRSSGEPFGFAPQLFESVFSLEVLEDGEISPVITLDEGRAVAVAVTEYRPSQQQPLAAVRDEIAADLELEEAIALAAIKGTELIERLQSGESATAVLAEVDAQFEQRQDLARGDASVPGELAAILFRAPKPQDGVADYQSVLLASGEFAIYRIKSVLPGQPEFFSQEDRDARKAQLAGRLGAGQLTGIVESLVREAAVTVVPDLLETDQGGI